MTCRMLLRGSLPPKPRVAPRPNAVCKASLTPRHPSSSCSATPLRGIYWTRRYRGGLLGHSSSSSQTRPSGPTPLPNKSRKHCRPFQIELRELVLDRSHGRPNPSSSVFEAMTFGENWFNGFGLKRCVSKDHHLYRLQQKVCLTLIKCLLVRGHRKPMWGGIFFAFDCF